ncbi:hypothetical protein [Methylobacterium sp. J-076]|uniref:hypothetical protein n=1 Tax=Methylobacterium sp. J-076 TaxID=2836655 RepID=UPI001FBAC73F|nr:hypothetical protein [Methylobacterium sp. J-076]MCJ2012059.1 hypothetical protein [Methylobacterium sp. J-076]
MTEDNPLWYDYVEADEGPGAVLVALAAGFAALAGAAALAWRALWLPDRLWRAASAALGRRAPEVRPARR